MGTVACPIVVYSLESYLHSNNTILKSNGTNKTPLARQLYMYTYTSPVALSFANYQIMKCITLFEPFVICKYNSYNYSKHCQSTTFFNTVYL